MLAPEMYKVSNNFEPCNMNEIFEIRNEHPYSLTQNRQFSRPLKKHETERFSYLGPKVWDVLPNIHNIIDGLQNSKRLLVGFI